MQVDPAIAALRGNRAPQRQAQAAMLAATDAWRAMPGVAPVLAAFERFGQGAALDDCPALEELFTEPALAERLMADLVTGYCGALRTNPLGHPPFRTGFDGRTGTILLGKAGRAQLVLQAREPGEQDALSATFTDMLRYDAVLAGAAEGTLLRIRGAGGAVRFSQEPMALQGGVRLAFDCNTETLAVTRVTRRLVTLRLLQAAERPAPAREYCRRTGSLLHQSAGTLASSRREMMAALLGRMGRTEAAPVLAQMALAEHDPSLRWQALRECLALDAAQGFPALSAIARAPHDGLAGPAGALRAQLIEQHPELQALEQA